MKLTLKEIKESEPKEKLDHERATNYLNGLTYRPPSRYAIWLLVRLGVTANQASIIGLLIGVVACVFLGWGTYWGFIIGGLVSCLQYFFDFVDGGLARATGTVSKRGYYVDALAGHFASLTTPIAIGYGLWVYTNYPIFLILGFILSVLIASRVLIQMEFIIAYSDQARDVIKPTRKDLWWFIYTFGTNTVNIYRYIFLIFAVLGMVYWWLILYIIVTILELSMALIVSLIKSKKE
jgi:phosphatidylglycerophosphate synthase